jgi:eukaryotic-like serine/threonine-protein kinase
VKPRDEGRSCRRWTEAGLSSDLSPGAVFAERYRVERRIASGGMGAVYEVVHIETNRRRALKVLHANLVQSEELRGRFRQEARVAAEIESEHIVDVFDAGIDVATEMPFLVMELLRGEDVRQRIKRVGPIPVDETVRILFEAALALDKTHQARIVHRDLKPDNLYLCERDHGLPRTKVLDFGIAKIVADGAMSGQTKESLGTPLYMAPEQFLMSANISGATDIFALGLISYTMLVGKPYWLEETLRAGAALAFAMHACKGPQESAVQRAAKHGITLPPAYDEWFFRACAPKIDNRFQVATTAIIELAQVLGVPIGMEASPISITGSGGPGRATLGSSVNVNSILSASQSGAIPPIRPPQPSIPGTNTPLQPVLTPIGSGLTNATSVPRSKSPAVAIAVAAVATVLIGGFIAYQVLSGSPSAPTNPELATAPPPTSASAIVAEPQVKPLVTETVAEPIPPPPTTTTSDKATIKSTKGSSAGTSTTPTVRPTGTGTSKKSSSGGVIWNND